MSVKPIGNRLKELQAQQSSREEKLRILYLEKYPIFEITQALDISSVELQGLNKRLKLFLLRCPVGHEFPKELALHAIDAHYCTACQRWFNETTLKDEIELEIRRLKERDEEFRKQLIETVTE